MAGFLPGSGSASPNNADWTVEDLRVFRNRLLEARANGVSRTSIRSPVSSRETEFRSDAEMAAAIKDLDRRIASLAGQSAASFVNIRSNRGWS